MDLDLGSKPVIKVRVGADTYDMSVPTVKQSIELGDLMNECGSDTARTHAFISFISSLGMPEDVLQDLSVEQMTKLSEGLIGASGAKK